MVWSASWRMRRFHSLAVLASVLHLVAPWQLPRARRPWPRMRRLTATSGSHGGVTMSGTLPPPKCQVYDAVFSEEMCEAMHMFTTEQDARAGRQEVIETRFRRGRRRRFRRRRHQPHRCRRHQRHHATAAVALATRLRT